MYYIHVYNDMLLRWPSVLSLISYVDIAAKTSGLFKCWIAFKLLLLL